MRPQDWIINYTPSLAGKIFIVTGGNSGLGYESVKAFASKGAEVILACRSLVKGNEAREKLLLEFPKANIVVMELDLADLSSVRNFAEKVKLNYTRLDILLNNAGIMMPPYQKTKDGFESQMGTNHLGHFALTGLLLDLLKNSPKSRVVNVSSLAHKQGFIDFENLLFLNGKNYTPFRAYAQSKLANLLFTYRLQSYFKKNGIDSISLAAHPGVSDTNLFGDIGPQWLQKIFKPLFKLFIQPASMGALPQIRACIDPLARGSFYFGPKGLGEMKGYPVLVKCTKAARSKRNAEKLWDTSERLTGVKFP